MPQITTFDPDQKMIHAVYSGTTSLDEIRVAAGEAIALAVKHECYNWFIDFAEARFQGFTFLNVIQFSEEFIRLALPHLGQNVYKVRRAMIIPKTEFLVRFIETASLNRGQQVKVFDNPEEARAWLKSGK
jgi:hypothetical protein